LKRDVYRNVRKYVPAEGRDEADRMPGSERQIFFAEYMSGRAGKKVQGSVTDAIRTRYRNDRGQLQVQVRKVETGLAVNAVDGKCSNTRTFGNR